MWLLEVKDSHAARYVKDECWSRGGSYEIELVILL